MNEAPRKIGTEGYLLAVEKIGDSVGVVLPEELVARLKLKVGDKLRVVEQTEQGIKLTRYSSKHAEAMEYARRSFRKYADAYRALAK